MHQLTKYLKNNPDIFKIGILLCLITGLRLGEICALRWEDIDFENKILCVKHTVQRIFDKKLGKTRLTETRPKSYYSEREIPVADEIINLLYLHRGEGYFFLGSRPMEPRTYQYKFYLYLKEAGITHMNFHILRHTFATNCIECGIDPKSLSEMLGHADVRITLNRYVHPTMQSKREYINKVVTFFAD